MPVCFFMRRVRKTLSNPVNGLLEEMPFCTDIRRHFRLARAADARHHCRNRILRGDRRCGSTVRHGICCGSLPDRLWICGGDRYIFGISAVTSGRGRCAVCRCGLNCVDRGNRIFQCQSGKKGMVSSVVFRRGDCGDRCAACRDNTAGLERYFVFYLPHCAGRCSSIFL